MTTVNAVSVKLPPFWVPYPAAWFVNVEAQFASRGVTQEKTKYEHVLQALPMEITCSILDFVSSIQDTETPYTDLKKILIERNSLSESKRLEQLLSGEEMGDRKPSDFYRYLKNLAGSSTSITAGLLKELWLRRLSSIVSAMVKSSGKTDIKDLLEVADSVHETLQVQNFSVNAVASSSSNNTNMAMIELQLQNQRLQAEILEIRGKLSRSGYSDDRDRRSYDSLRGPSSNRYDNRGRFHNRGRSPNRFNNRGCSPPQNRNRDEFCYYHRTYGNRAQQCKPPCNFNHPN